MQYNRVDNALTQSITRRRDINTPDDFFLNFVVVDVHERGCFAAKSFSKATTILPPETHPTFVLLFLELVLLLSVSF
jgi:hypothetical protein